MLPTTNRSHRTGLPATGLGSILVVAPLLAVGPGDRAVVTTTAVAVRSDEAPSASADGRVHDLSGSAVVRGPAAGPGTETGR